MQPTPRTNLQGITLPGGRKSRGMWFHLEKEHSRNSKVVEMENRLVVVAGAGREVGVEGKGTRGTSVALELLGISGGGFSGLHRLKRKGISHSHSHTQSRRRAGNPSKITDGASTSRCDLVLAVQVLPRGTLGSGCGSISFLTAACLSTPAQEKVQLNGVSLGKLSF